MGLTAVVLVGGISRQKREVKPGKTVDFFPFM